MWLIIILLFIMRDSALMVSLFASIRRHLHTPCVTSTRTDQALTVDILLLVVLAFFLLPLLLNEDISKTLDFPRISNYLEVATGVMEPKPKHKRSRDDDDDDDDEHPKALAIESGSLAAGEAIGLRHDQMMASNAEHLASVRGIRNLTAANKPLTLSPATMLPKQRFNVSYSGEPILKLADDAFTFKRVIPPEPESKPMPAQGESETTSRKKTVDRLPMVAKYVAGGMPEHGPSIFVFKGAKLCAACRFPIKVDLEFTASGVTYDLDLQAIPEKSIVWLDQFIRSSVRDGGVPNGDPAISMNRQPLKAANVKCITITKWRYACIIDHEILVGTEVLIERKTGPEPRTYPAHLIYSATEIPGAKDNPDFEDMRNLQYSEYYKARPSLGPSSTASVPPSSFVTRGSNMDMLTAPGDYRGKRSRQE